MNIALVIGINGYWPHIGRCDDCEKVLEEFSLHPDSFMPKC